MESVRFVGHIGRAPRHRDKQHGARHQPRAVGLLGGDLLGRVHGELACLLVHVVHDVLHRVIRLRDDCAREGVGLANVRAGLIVPTVDLADRVRLREDEKIVVALQLLRRRAVLEHLHAEVLLGELVLLDRGAHRAIDDHDALLHALREVVVDLLRILLASQAPRQVGPVALYLLGHLLRRSLEGSTGCATGLGRGLAERQLLRQRLDHLG